MAEDEEEENLPQTLLDKLPLMIKEDFEARFADKKEREDIFNETLNCVKDLHTIYTKVVPCFPPHYDIFNVYKNAYLENIQAKLKLFLNQEELENSPGLLIPIAHWLSEFGDGLKNVGIDINETELAADITYYMHYFFEHVNQILESNLNTVLKKNAQDKNKLKNAKNIDLGNIPSYYATDVYNSITNVIDLLSGDFKGQLLFQIINQVCIKIEELIKKTEESVSKSDNLIVTCVYVSDANKCLEQFPKFKKIKELLPKDLYKHIKLTYINGTPSILSMYNSNIRIGCNKIVELMFKEIESRTLNKMFTSEWNDEILEDIFGTFSEYFNKGFVKILKSQMNLLILVRCFIDSFVWYYVEEIIHSIRSLNRKTLTKDEPLANYQFKYLTMNESELLYKQIKKKKDKNKEKEEEEDFILNDIKNLDKEEEKKNQNVEFKKYSFPVKKFKDADKTFKPEEVISRMERDREIFSDFLFGFSDETTSPFSAQFSETLGTNYIKNFENKFDVMINVTKCQSQNDVKEKIIQLKEYYCGIEGKALSEALLYIRVDAENVTKQDMKSYFLSCFDPK